MWKSIASTFILCPFSILKYNSHSNTLSWNKVRLSHLYYIYITIGSINIILLVTYIVYKILQTPMSPAEQAIHYGLFSVAIFAWPLSLICTYTCIGNSGFCCYFYNLLSRFEQSTIRKIINRNTVFIIE